MSQDDKQFLDELPVGTDQLTTPPKKKKKVVKKTPFEKKRVRRRLQPAAGPSDDETPFFEESVDQPRTVEPHLDIPAPDSEAFDDPELGEPSDSGDSEPEPPANEPAPPVNESEPSANDNLAPTTQNEPASPSTDDLLPRPSEFKSPPEAATDATLPTPVPVVVKKPCPRSTAKPTAKPTTTINKRWDDFLRALNAATRESIWELGIKSITAFREYTREDLVRPRGRLTEGQVNEVEEWLNAHNIQLAASKVSHGAHPDRNFGQQLSSPGIRVPAKPRAALSKNATAAQRRHDRVSRNRLTM